MCQQGIEKLHSLILYVIFVFYKEDRLGYLEAHHTQFQLSYRQACVLTPAKMTSEFSFLISTKNQESEQWFVVTKQRQQDQFKPESRPMLNTLPSCNLKDCLAK